MNIAILGAGAWGTALAAHAAHQHDVLLWSRNAGQAAAIAASRVNADYLPGVTLPAMLRVAADFDAVLAHARDGLLVVATPLAALGAMVDAVLAQDARPAGLVWLCKGIDAQTGELPHQIVRRAAAGRVPPWPSGVLSGPSFAREVALALPCALVAASPDAGLRARMQEAFHHHAMRIYASDDLVGVEIGGAVKNVLAIATGISDGMGLGMNARAALITRGLAEMARLAQALGARLDTLHGLTGIGDLLLTATGDLSRNRTVGLKLAQGLPLSAILADLGHVAEGVRCADAVCRLATRTGVDMPITAAVCAVLAGECTPQEALARLLRRDPRDEH